MKRLSIQWILLFSIFVFISCASDDDSNLTAVSTTSVKSEADFGSTLNSAVPSGLKTGTASSSSSVYFIQPDDRLEDLSGTCLSDYTSCPNVTEENGWDSDTGEILSKIWAIDYNDECTSAKLADGTCFELTGATGYSKYIQPTLLEAPSTCSDLSTSDIKALNFGIDPCFFDAKIAEIQKYSECKDGDGTAYDISTIVPWYSTWSIPQTVTFKGFSGTAGAGMYWTIANTDGKKYFISVDSNWLYGGIKDETNNEFFFFGTGSPAYYVSAGEDSGVNLSAYAGDIPVNNVLGTFETIQIRSQGANKYIKRQLVNSTHVWYQSWSGSFPTTSTEAENVKNTPDDNRCLEIGASVSQSKYVPFTNCYTAFSKASQTEMNADSNFKLKIFDQQTLESINFSTRLVSTDSECQ